MTSPFSEADWRLSQHTGQSWQRRQCLKHQVLKMEGELENGEEEKLPGREVIRFKGGEQQIADRFGGCVQRWVWVLGLRGSPHLSSSAGTHRQAGRAGSCTSQFLAKSDNARGGAGAVRNWGKSRGVSPHRPLLQVVSWCGCVPTVDPSVIGLTLP